MTRDDAPPEGTAELRRLYALLGSDDQGPSDDDLLALIAGRLQGAEKNRVLEQLVESPDAVARYRLLLEIRDRAPAGRGSGVSRRNWAVAAALLAALSLSLLFIPAPVEEPRLRGSASAAHPAGMAKLMAPPERLSWPVPDGDSRAEVRVSMYDEAANPVWATVAEAQGNYVLTQAERLALADGGVYFWTVENSRGEEYGPYWFRIDE